MLWTCGVRSLQVSIAGTCIQPWGQTDQHSWGADAQEAGRRAASTGAEDVAREPAVSTSVWLPVCCWQMSVFFVTGKPQSHKSAGTMNLPVALLSSTIEPLMQLDSKSGTVCHRPPRAVLTVAGDVFIWAVRLQKYSYLLTYPLTYIWTLWRPLGCL